MLKALVVDDSRQPADSLCLMLSLIEISARAAYGPRAAILAFQEEKPDVIFLDINMPTVDGFEMMSYIRREPGMSKVPIIIVTADDSPATAAKALQRGAVDVIVKPATVEAIEKALKTAKLL